MINCGAVLPHPPIAVPEVGGIEAEKVKNTQAAMEEAGRRIRESGASVLVMISPHSPVYGNKFRVNAAGALGGNLGQFGAPQVRFECGCDGELAAEIKRQADDAGVEAVFPGFDEGEKQAGPVRLKGYFEMDHGLMVPLYFLRKAGVNLPLVPISIAFLSLEEHYSFGKVIAKAARALKKEVAVIASGDLSHRLTRGAPAGYDPLGREFDARVRELVERADARGLLALDAELVERAGECGLRPIVMLFGAFDGCSLKPEVLSYEGPFGVGYMVAVVEPRGEAGEPGIDSQCNEAAGKACLSGSCDSHAFDSQAKETGAAAGSYLVQKARESLENYVRGKWKRPEERDDIEVPDEFKHAAGAFVSIKKHGQLRGCIGTITPQRDNVVYEVIYNAVAAGTEDPRFPPVTEEELDELEYSVDVLGKPEPVKSIAELNPKKYGVIVRRGFRSGLLLPDLEGINTASEQVEIARRKAGIAPYEEVELERFEVKRYKEKK